MTPSLDRVLHRSDDALLRCLAELVGDVADELHAVGEPQVLGALADLRVGAALVADAEERHVELRQAWLELELIRQSRIASLNDEISTTRTILQRSRKLLA